MGLFGNRIKVVFFDVGGVLIDADLDRYIPICCAKLQATPEAVRREVSERVPALERGTMDSETFWQEVGESLWRQGQGNLPDSHEFYRLWGDLLTSSLTINSDVVKLCQLLRLNKIKLGLLTNAIAEHADILTQRGIYSPFDPCIVSCRVGMRKPEADIYRLAASQAQVKPKECLLIDDQPANVEAACKVGMEGIVFTNAASLAQALWQRELIK